MEPMQINTDASAAIRIGNKLGIGKVAHIEVNQLWLQDTVCKGEIILRKIGARENIVDVLTKAVNAKTLQHHVDHSAV